MLRRTILATACLALVPPAARAEFKPGYTYHVTGTATMYRCKTPDTTYTSRLHIWFYAANARDVYTFLGETSDIRFDVARARTRGRNSTRVSYFASGQRRWVEGRMAINGDRVTVHLLTTNQGGGKRQFGWEFLRPAPPVRRWPIGSVPADALCS